MINLMNISFDNMSVYNMMVDKFPKFIIENEDYLDCQMQYLLTDFERDFVSRIVSLFDSPSKYLEIGSSIGWNLINVAYSNPSMKIYSIDDYNFPHFNNNDADCVYKTTISNLIRHDMLDKMCLIKGTSQNMLSIIPNDYFDCIFVDGNHSQEYFYKNIIMAYSKLKKNGILFGHGSLNRNVNNVILRFFENPLYNFLETHIDVAAFLNKNVMNSGIWFVIKGE